MGDHVDTKDVGGGGERYKDLIRFVSAISLILTQVLKLKIVEIRVE